MKFDMFSIALINKTILLVLQKLVFLTNCTGIVYWPWPKINVSVYRVPIF